MDGVETHTSYGLYIENKAQINAPPSVDECWTIPSIAPPPDSQKKPISQGIITHNFQGHLYSCLVWAKPMPRLTAQKLNTKNSLISPAQGGGCFTIFSCAQAYSLTSSQAMHLNLLSSSTRAWPIQACIAPCFPAHSIRESDVLLQKNAM
jgi:hypothetical protein